MAQEQFTKPLQGVSGDFHAFREGDCINVCDGDYDTLFSVPADWTAEHVNEVIAIYNRAHAAGQRTGRAAAQAAMRAAMGIEG